MLPVRRSYSATDSTTTAGLPRFVTVCGVPLEAASTTALKLFFASCSDHSVRAIARSIWPAIWTADTLRRRVRQVSGQQLTRGIGDGLIGRSIFPREGRVAKFRIATPAG